MSLVQDIAVLCQIPMLSDFDDDQLRLLAFSAESQEYADGDTLFDQGDRADGGIAIAEGRVSLQQKDNSDFKEIDEVGPGTLLGETAILVETRRPVRAVARGPVRTIRIRRALFKRMILEYPDLARKLFETHAARYVQTVSGLGPIGDRMAELNDIADRLKSATQSPEK